MDELFDLGENAIKLYFFLAQHSNGGEQPVAVPVRTLANMIKLGYQQTRTALTKLIAANLVKQNTALSNNGVTQKLTQKVTQNITQVKPLIINTQSDTYKMLKEIFNAKCNAIINVRYNANTLSNKTTPTKPKIPSTLNGLARKKFEDFFRETYQDEYYWTAKDAGNMAQLLKKVAFARSSRNLPIDDESMINALHALLSSIKDDWILQNFSVPNINCKYNEIVSQAKTKGETKKTVRPEDTGIIYHAQNNNTIDNRW